MKVQQRSDTTRFCGGVRFQDQGDYEIAMDRLQSLFSGNRDFDVAMDRFGCYIIAMRAPELSILQSSLEEVQVFGIRLDQGAMSQLNAQVQHSYHVWPNRGGSA